MNREPLQKYLRYDSAENLLLCVDEHTNSTELAHALCDAFDIEMSVATSVAAELKTNKTELSAIDDLILEISVNGLIYDMVQRGEIDLGIGPDGDFWVGPTKDSPASP